MAEHDRSAGTVFVAFALGAIAGATVALLYAPGAGDETRRKLTEKAREGRQRAQAAARRGGEILREQRKNLNEAIERGVEAFQKARKETL
jgi:gas vesicle protein